LHRAADRLGDPRLAADGAYDHDCVARGRAVVPDLPAHAVTTRENLYASRTSFEGIFLRRDGRTLAGRRAHRLRGRVLCDRATLWRVGSAGAQLRRVDQHALSVDFGRGNRPARFDERRVYISAVRDSLFRTDD